MRSNTFREGGCFHDRFWRSFRHGLNVNARLSVGAFKGIFPAFSAVARESRKAVFFNTGSTAVTVVIEATNIAMHFVLTVWTDLGIPR